MTYNNSDNNRPSGSNTGYRTDNRGRNSNSSGYNRNNNNRRPYNNRNSSNYRGNRNNNQGQNGGTFNDALRQDQPVGELATDTLRVIPLGGQGETGRHSWVYEYNEEIIIVDAGWGLVPHGLKGGVDLLLQNIEYLKEKQTKIKALVLSNSNLEYSANCIKLIQELNIQEVYMPALVQELYAQELNNIKSLKVNTIKNTEEFKVGEEFTIKPLAMAFNSPDSYGFLVKTKTSKVFYTSGWKVDHCPPVKKFATNLQETIEHLTHEQVDLLISHSLNTLEEGYSPSESAMQGKIDNLLEKAKSRVIAITSRNYIHRIQVFINSAIKYNKKLCLFNKELQDLYSICNKLNYFEGTDKIKLIKPQDIKKSKDNNLLVLISQIESNILEPMFTLGGDGYEDLSLQIDDIVALAADKPLGTTRKIAKAIDDIIAKGGQVAPPGLHVNSFAGQEELKFMYNLARPKYFLPAGGEVRELVHHGELFATCGLNASNILIVDNGNAIEFNNSKSTIEITGKVPAAPLFYSQESDIPMNNRSLEERQQLSQDGMVTIGIAIDSKKLQIVSDVYIQTVGNGFHGSDDWVEIEDALKTDVQEIIKKALLTGHSDKNLLVRLVKEVFNKKTREGLGMFSPILSVSVQDIA